MKDAISILLLAHNKSDYTKRCLDALFSTSLRPFQVILVNNGSKDDTRDVFDAFAQKAHALEIDVEILDFKENRGAIVGRNKGMERMTGAFWVFMDNDIVVRTRSWLLKMRTHLKQNPDVGVVGPKLVYPLPPHDIQCAGCQVTTGGQVIFSGRGQARESAEWNQARDCQTLISACWMMPAHVARKVGALDERFSPVQFEDIDYCYRIRAAGFRCRYIPEVEMYHFENVTSGRTDSLNYPYLTVKNGLKFKKKWEPCFAHEGGPEDKDWRWARIATVLLDAIPPVLETRP